MILTYRAFIIIILILTQSGLAQQRSQKGQSAPKKSSSVSDSETEMIEQEKKLAVLRVRGFTEQVLAFRDVKIKIRAIARLADLLWKHDEPYARQLFSKALDLCSPQTGLSSTESESMARLRREVIVILAKRDANLVKLLIDAGDEANTAERLKTDFTTALDLLKTQPEKSIEFAERSLRSGIPPDMNSLLILLRLKNETVANSLFLKTLDQLVAQPVVDIDTLLLIGTYVFTSPKFDPNDPAIAPDMIRMVGVGRLLVYDITADRPNVPREIVRSYLRAATEIITRAISNPTQRQKYYVAARLLLPKTEKFAPELTPVIAAAMQSLMSDIPQDLTLSSSYANLEVAAPKELSEMIEGIEKERNEPRREARYLSLVSDLWQQSEFEKARVVNAKISDIETRASLATLIDFGDAANKLKRGKAAIEAEQIALKLPQSIERALLLLGIAHAHARAGNIQRASESIDALLKTARSVNDARRPFLTLSAAGQLARFDPWLAQITLAEAVRQFNTQKPESLAEISWTQRVEAGVLWRDFPLDVNGVDRDFKQILPSLIRIDMEGTTATVRKLTDERQLAQALLAVAAAILT